MERGLEFLALDLTHRCNLSCDFCGKLTKGERFQITMTQLERFCALCKDTPAKFIRVSGGEVTTHPQFRTMIEYILKEMAKPIELATNGIRLVEYEDMVPMFAKIHITEYPGVNDEAVQRFRRYPNVNIITLQRIYDVALDPNWTVEQGQQAYDHCCRAQINVCNDKVYGCCMAETLERRGKLSSVHVKLAPGWVEAYRKLSCIEACRHCFIAATEGWA